jgi:large conductance mechanosensitive channel
MVIAEVNEKMPRTYGDSFIPVDLVDAMVVSDKDILEYTLPQSDPTIDAIAKNVASLVEDVLMPPIGQLVGRVDFSGLFLSLDGKSYETLAAAKQAHAATLNYGVFINSIINFLIVAFAVFLVVQQFNHWSKKLEKPEAAAGPTTKDCPQCAMTIPISAKRCGHCTSQF